ncbi:MAG: hypothetical protein ABJE95_27795 [Byssovorax sp.]
MNLQTKLVLLITAATMSVTACGSSTPATGGTTAQGTSGTGAGGDGTSSTSDASSASGTGGSGGGTFAAAHEPFPQVPNRGGAILPHAQVVTVTFANDARAPTFESFAKWIVGSKWLTTVGAEYGIGAGAVAGVAHRPETPPAKLTSDDIETYLANGVADKSIPSPAAPATLADALYLVYYPATTAITTTFVNGIIKHSCTDFVAYHGEVHHAGLDFSYAVVPDCAAVLPSLSALESFEVFASHEFIEAVTDALPITKPAWQLVPDPESAWFTSFQFEVETGDLCEYQNSYAHEAGFAAQRSWSNLAAAAGGDPCLPVEPPVPYFNTTATPDAVVHAKPGTTVDYTLKGWSTAPVSSWSLGLSKSGTLSVTTKFSGTKLNNGQTATLHVTIPADAVAGTSATLVLSSQHTNADANFWFMNIAVP